MGLLDWLFSRKKTDILELERIKKAEFLEEKNEIKLNLERQKAEIQLDTYKKQEKVKQAELDLELAELQAEIDDINGVEDDPIVAGEQTPESKILDLVSQAMASQKHNNKNNSQSPDDRAFFLENNENSETTSSDSVKSSGGVSFTDAQLKEMWAQVPKAQQQQAKNTPNILLRQYLSSKFPNVTEDTLDRAVAIAKSKREE